MVAETNAMIGEDGGNKCRDWRRWQKQTSRLETVAETKALTIVSETNALTKVAETNAKVAETNTLSKVVTGWDSI